MQVVLCLTCHIEEGYRSLKGGSEDCIVTLKTSNNILYLSRNPRLTKLKDLFVIISSTRVIAISFIAFTILHSSFCNRKIEVTTFILVIGTYVRIAFHYSFFFCKDYVI